MTPSPYAGRCWTAPTYVPGARRQAVRLSRPARFGAGEKGRHARRGRAHGVAGYLKAVRRQATLRQDIHGAPYVAHLLRAQREARAAGASRGPQVEQQHYMPLDGKPGRDLWEVAARLMLAIR